MRKLLIFLLLLASFATAAISGFVNDEANVLSPTDTARIESVLSSIKTSKQAEYAVVIVQSLEGKDIESFALNLAQGNLGDSEKNNGLLLLIAVEDRKYRFEVGRGIEPILNDAKVGRIGRNFLVPNLQNGNYGQGIFEASVAVAQEFEVDVGATVAPPVVRRRSAFSSWFSLLFYIMVISSVFGGARGRYRRRDRFFNAALMAGLMFGGRGRGGLGGMGGGFGGGGFGGGGFGGGGAGGSF